MIDGTLAGTTGPVIVALPKGLHLVEFTLAGFKPYQTTITVTLPSSLVFNLEPKAEPGAVAQERPPKTADTDRQGPADTAADDAEKFSEGRVALDKFKDCGAALSALGEISETGRKDPLWSYYMAKATDCKQDYAKALPFYVEYNRLVPGQSQILERIAELKYLIRKIEIDRKKIEAERAAVRSNILGRWQFKIDGSRPWQVDVEIVKDPGWADHYNVVIVADAGLDYVTGQILMQGLYPGRNNERQFEGRLYSRAKAERKVVEECGDKVNQISEAYISMEINEIGTQFSMTKLIDLKFPPSRANLPNCDQIEETPISIGLYRAYPGLN